MLQRNKTRGMIMTTHRLDSAHGWFDNGHAADWTKRVGDAASNLLKSVNTGLKAAHEYQRLTAAHVPPQKATAVVRQKYFSDR